jgi:hypothetical protein
MKRFYIILSVVLVVLGLAVWGSIGIAKHLIVAIDRIADSTVAAENKTGEAADATKATVAAATATLQQTTVTLAEGQRTLQAFDPVIGKAGVAVDNFNAATVALQRPCKVYNIKGSPFYTPFYSEGSVMPCGLLPDITDVLHTTRGTLGVFEVAGNHWNKNLTTVDAQETTLFNDVHTTFTNANAKLTDPRVDRFMTHLDSTSGNFDKIVADGQVKAHKLLNPDKVRLTFWTGTEAGLDWIHTYIIPSVMLF